ncbi:hypothetical protein NUBL21999_32680 [Klebsiella pneumoniae]|nr:hypothetical protein NUBL21999_32680 [Klebsiella pneumoniae]
MIASPPYIWVMLTTAESCGDKRREGMVCSAIISCAAATIGSAPLSGIAA